MYLLVNYRMNSGNYTILPILIGATLMLSGCMSSSTHLRKADESAAGIISEYQQKAIGHTEDFSIDENANSLRRRLMIEQDLPGHVSGVTSNNLFKTDKPLRITLNEALQIAARNSRGYQSEKEKVFEFALKLDLTRSEYRNSYSGLLSSLFSNETKSDGDLQTVDSNAKAGITRKLQTGATITSKLGLDLVKLLTMDETSTFGILADATVTIPLLAGAGKDIAREPLTQAERDVIYSIWEFERFKKSFAVSVASDYLRTLEIEKQIQNATFNYESIFAARERMEALSKAGRVSQTEVDQASQNELKANNSVISAKQGFEEKLDSFKVTLGIPVDAEVELSAEDLVNISKELMDQLEREKSLSNDQINKLINQSVLTALTNRLDLITVRDRHEDMKRKLNVAEDALDTDMKLVLSGTTRQTDISGGTPSLDKDGAVTATPQDGELDFGDINYSAMLELNLPWDKTAERVAFRKSLIALRHSERSIEEKEDNVKAEIRNAVRRIAELKETYHIQQQAVTLAERRVKSTELFMQAGKVQIRDLLEAQEALVHAKDSLVSAVVSYHIATLGLQRDLGLLTVDEKGLWRDNENTK